MRAIVQRQYGSADVLRIEEIDLPSIGAGEVLIRVHAAGLDRGTWHLMSGQPYAMRPVALTPSGTLVIVGGEGGGNWVGMNVSCGRWHSHHSSISGSGCSSPSTAWPTSNGSLNSSMPAS
jgi:NADPH:quinone reductase-like Zn-dependent oxidoreductase